MSSAICFNLDQSKILLSGNGLNVAPMMISVFDRVENIVGKGIKMLVTISFLTDKRIIFSFSHNLNQFQEVGQNQALPRRILLP